MVEYLSAARDGRAKGAPQRLVSRRVAWEKKLSVEEGLRFVDIKFIDDGWLSNGPELPNHGTKEFSVGKQRQTQKVQT
ncbi:hypothetical protein EJB05_10777, partial [Eragrostis curvula]